jgi:hypothetical protein
MSILPSLTRLRRGILLFEVILALAVFSLVVVALASCLQRTLESVRLGQMEVYVQEQLTNHLALSRLQPLTPGRLEEKADTRGVRYTREVEPLVFETKDRLPVSGLLRLRWTASWSGPAGPQTKSYQVYVKAL